MSESTVARPSSGITALRVPKETRLGTAGITNGNTISSVSADGVTATLSAATTAAETNETVKVYNTASCTGIAPTDGSGGNTHTDAKRYPCPPTAAQEAAGATCVVAYGDLAGDTATQPLRFGPMSVVTTETDIAGGVVGTSYAQQLLSENGTAPYTWKCPACSSNIQPWNPANPKTGRASAAIVAPGLKLNAKGVITGIPSQTGTYSFTLTDTDKGSDAQNDNLKQTLTENYSITFTEGSPSVTVTTDLASPQAYGTKVTVTASVVGTAAKTPYAGTFTFTHDGATALDCATTVYAKNKAVCTTSTAALGSPGTHEIDVNISNDGNYQAAEGSLTGYVTTTAPTKATVKASPASTPDTGDVTYTMTLTTKVVNPGVTAPASNTTFKTDSTTLCSSSTYSGSAPKWTVTCTATPASAGITTAGTYPVTADFPGGTLYEAATSAPVNLKVTVAS